MEQIDIQLSHVWMVRAFLKHSDEAEEDDDVRDVHRALYDYMLALGSAWDEKDAQKYLKLAKKKFSKLRQATADFVELQPEISTHTNFKMAVRSLSAAVGEIEKLLAKANSA